MQMYAVCHYFGDELQFCSYWVQLCPGATPSYPWLHSRVQGQLSYENGTPVQFFIIFILGVIRILPIWKHSSGRPGQHHVLIFILGRKLTVPDLGGLASAKKVFSSASDGGTFEGWHVKAFSAIDAVKAGSTHPLQYHRPNMAYHCTNLLFARGLLPSDPGSEMGVCPTSGSLWV